MTERRRQAFSQFEELSHSSLDEEEWKRIDLRSFRPERYEIRNTLPAQSTFDLLLADRTEFGGRVTHIDGCTQASQLDGTLRKQGVIFGSLQDVLQAHPDLLQDYWMQRAVPNGRDRFSAWHAAFCTGGTVLYVPKGVDVEAPLYSFIGLASENAADLSHTLVILENGASATLLEETASANPDLSGLHIGAVELLVGDGAHLQYVQLQNWGTKVCHFAHQAGRVAGNGSLRWTVGGLGARIAHIHQDVFLDGPAAEAQVNGVTFASEKQLISYYTQQTHAAPFTRSDLLYKQVLRDRARGIWRGMIRVDEGAQKTDGYQRNDTLLLSGDSRADAIPGLEIEADDVRCTHGATAGRVDEEQIFYCMARGISEMEAKHMIVEGFFQTVLDRIPVEVVRETLNRAVEKKLGIERLQGV
ncbi:MAG: Fe-S cluster assembly protein SufD [Planctomycetota bacterium]|nr:Fe-S cluster assembly protein SufD [Planctomycetota bacterium]MDA1212054.1 Fe-S cluster assembly protein SufD [Planctomycetota bacterium]